MGLDMYLYLEKYESKSKWGSIRQNEEMHYPQELKEFEEEIYEHNFMSVHSRYQIGYWRKANEIFKLIVDTCYSKGYDNYRGDDLYLGKNDLQNMLDTLNVVLNDLKTCPQHLGQYDEIIYESKVAKNLLPRQEGFFFGNQDINTYYKNDLEYTIKLFNNVLKFLEENHNYECVFHASW